MFKGELKGKLKGKLNWKLKGELKGEVKGEVVYSRCRRHQILVASHSYGWYAMSFTLTPMPLGIGYWFFDYILIHSRFRDPSVNFLKAAAAFLLGIWHKGRYLSV